MRAFNRFIHFEILIICLVAVGLLNHTVWSRDFDHQYGIEVRGGYSLYLDNADPNSLVQGFTGGTGYTQQEYTESLGAFGGGFSLLLKSEPYFGWHIGLNVLATDSATATAVNGNQTQMAQVFVNSVELFFTANYYWHITPRFNLQFGAGPAFYLSSMDRVTPEGSDATYGETFYGAHGRSFGFKGDAGMEFFLSSAVAFKLGAGFRWAPVNRFKYFKESGTITEGQIAYWKTGSFDTFEANFSGAYIDVGLRFYFDPVSYWIGEKD